MSEHPVFCLSLTFLCDVLNQPNAYVFSFYCLSSLLQIFSNSFLSLPLNISIDCCAKVRMILSLIFIFAQ